MNIKGYRKVGFAVFVVLTTTLALMTRFLQSEHYVSIMQAVIYGYLGANAVQAVGTKIAEKVEVGARTDGATTSQG